MSCRGIRGAVTATDNSRDAILEATGELLQALAAANDLQPEDISSVTFTVTPDLNAVFPAEAARRFGWNHVPLLDAVEMDVPDALPMCIRVLVHWNTDRPPYAIRHVYLRGATRLRPDLQQDAVADAGDERHPISAASQRKPTTPSPLPRAGAASMIAFQGEPGAYSQEAIYQHFGTQVGTMPCRTFNDIFAAVEQGKATDGLLPVENSQAGSVSQSFDLLLDRDLRVVGEVKLRVRHCLLAPANVSMADIRRVRSHPQALAQCERYIRTRGWEAIPAYDTAGSARELAAKPEPDTAAIASELAGRTYGMQVLDTGIEDSADNTTRFFLLGREEPPPGRQNKTSIVFATLHTPGALYNALGEFASRGINLAKIESHPRRNRPWHYVFYVDLEGHWQDAAIHRALIGLLARTAFVKLLGSYPAAPEMPAGE